MVTHRARWTLRVAEAAVAVARRAMGALPPRIVRDVQHRVLYSIFQKTRVENDAYGWRPPPPGEAD